MVREANELVYSTTFIIPIFPNIILCVVFRHYLLIFLCYSGYWLYSKLFIAGRTSNF